MRGKWGRGGRQPLLSPQQWGWRWRFWARGARLQLIILKGLLWLGFQLGLVHILKRQKSMGSSLYASSLPSFFPSLFIQSRTCWKEGILNCNLWPLHLPQVHPERKSMQCEASWSKPWVVWAVGHIGLDWDPWTGKVCSPHPLPARLVRGSRGLWAPSLWPFPSGHRQWVGREDLIDWM